MPPRQRLDDVLLQPVLVSSAMRALDRILRTIANKDVVVTFIGESGTGKEILARRLHELSSRRGGPFVPINCAAIPDTLFESELFGHEKGSFTGASARARGKIEAASGGTLFLDEIGEMPLSVQAKLLRFLENRKFMRVGGTTKITVDVRLVTATLRPLADEVKAGRFRADLHYRIQGVTLHVPPLRERRADIAPLTRVLLAEAAARHGTELPRLARVVTAAFARYDWPGNVRELRNVVELACLMRGGRSVRLRDVPEPLQRAATSGSPEDASAPGAGNRLVIDMDDPLDVSIERIVLAALACEGGNRSRAARRLGIGLRTMQRYAGRLGVPPPSRA
ncbi:MAG: sigma-54-dependent Fis family transcriptional regulator [Deltaproteobacteria bacterium]|nr:sigma-54-dependent Fis family transcriptional regulator [Deltaproteobacteria bacterium]